MRPPVIHGEQAPTRILCWSGEGSVKNIWPFRTISHPAVPSLCMFRVCHHLVVSSASVGALSWGRECLVSDSPQNPYQCPPLLIFYPPPFRSQTVLCFPQQVLMPSSAKLEIFGKFQGTRPIFFGFLRQSIGNENPFIFVGEFARNSPPDRTWIFASAPA